MINKVKELLKKYFGYEDFKKGQKQVVESILNGEDVLAIMPTGGGKSICYQIPSLILEGITIVISPLISLMKDQVDTLISNGIPSTFINSSQDYYEIKEIMYNIKKGKYKIVYVAPERLETTDFVELLNSINISLIAIDEAHCVSQWGHDFRQSYLKIALVISQMGSKPIVTALTATATIQVKNDIVDLLGLNNPKVYVTGFDRENLHFSVLKGVTGKNFIDYYIEKHKNQSGIIYCATRKEVESMHAYLLNKGYKVGKYHAGMSDIERIKNQEDFLFDNIDIIIATNAFGMGIDKSNVRFVIHNNMPKSMEAYYQEAGRAGRDGEHSECILLFKPRDIVLQKYFIEEIEDTDEERKKTKYQKLQAMIDYCHTAGCLRQYILRYFGEDNVASQCNNCSNCCDELEKIDITIEAQKIFSCIYRMREHFGSSMIAAVLKGSKSKKVMQFNLDKLSTYGIMKEYSIDYIKDLINVFTAEDYLCITESKFPIIKLQSRAIDALKGKEKVYRKIRKQIKIVKNDNLFEELRKLRKQISEEENMPPYIIFQDNTLKEMSKYYPIDKYNMLNIKGVGISKYEKYGDRFITVIKDYIERNNIDINKIGIKSVQRSTNKVSIKEPTYITTYNLYKQFNDISKVAKERGLKEKTIQEHIIKCCEEGFEIDIDQLIPAQYEEQIKRVIEEVGFERLRPIKDALPDEVDYMAIKAVIWKRFKN